MDRAGPDGMAGAERLRQADELRDQGMWDAALIAYRDHLEAQPDDWQARIQLGHCLKETGDPAAALAAYRDAERMAPNSADLHLQIGHALKLTGDPEAAWREYARALELDPSNEAAAREASALSRLASPLVQRPRAPGQAVQIVFDTSDLVAYFAHNRTPTGVQRVQLNITARALLDPIEGAATAAVTFDSGSGFWKEIGRDLFLRLWRLSRIGGDHKADDWVEAVEALDKAVAEGPDFTFAPGASLVNLGTSWWIRDYFLRVRQVRRQFGVRYVPLIHDCIPLMAPEHCAAALVEEFAQWFSGMAALADSALAVSEWSAADARRIASQVVPGLDLPVTVTRLDADLKRELGGGAAAGWPARADLPQPGEDYVLCVGTIESRKNHLMLFHAWLSLIRRHGPARVPRLVCIGKAGWLAEAAMALLENSPELQERVSIAHGVPDVVLAGLYGHAMFTVTNSFYEGWGLPVTESLAFGRVPLVARNTSLIEAGGQAAVFFEPMSVPDLVAKLESLIFEPEERARREAALAETVKLRSWGEIADQVMREVASRREAPPAQRPQLMLEAGRTHPLRLAGGGKASSDKALADLVRDGLNWHQLEAWGVWTRPGIARLRLPLPPLLRQGSLRVYLGCVGAAATSVGLRVHGAEGSVPRFAPVAVAEGGVRFTCMLEVEAAGEELLVEIDSGKGVALGSRKNPDDRIAGLGLTAFMVCRADDLGARIDFLERQAFRMIEPG